VTGVAYVERSGFENIDTLDDFFSAVGKEVRDSVAAMLPFSPSHREMRDLIASEELEHYMEGVDPASMATTLIAPIREIADRGGKSWRSYAALACCDVVGGDSRQFVQWLAMPELMHVGSLIVDDVQDRSTVRRGGPTCHLVHGEAVAINAGTAAYFLTQHLLHSDDLSAERKLRIYDLYFAAMRAGHAGQAIDLGGMTELMPEVVATGDSRALTARVLACHRLKTAAPAGCLARMGAVAGGGDDEQIAAVGEFFEALGVAFQIVDDVLNLRGFKGDLKQRGEDISNGAVTLPVAIAMARLPRERREWLWKTLESRPTDAPTVAAAVELLESCGAVAACADMARELVEAGWRRAEPLLEPSLSRVMLRAFGWYVLERHY
jgi:geranylgeranyl pyrophosphate synthase